MEPIVSPWFIYFLPVVQSIKGIVTCSSVVFFIASAWYLIGRLVTRHDNKDDEWKQAWGKAGPGAVILFITFSLLSITIPSKDTLIAIFVAKNLTYNRIEGAIEKSKLFKDEIKKDIIGLIEAVQKEQSEK